MAHAAGRARTADEGSGRHSRPRGGLLKPKGRIAYVTCSVLDEENGAQIRGFLARQSGFKPLPPGEVMKALGERAFLFRRAVLISDEGLLMTPRRTDTDGFYREYIGPIRLIFRPISTDSR